MNPRLLLFGDQTVETLAAVRSLFEVSKRSLLVRKFLVEATDVVKSHVEQLDSAERMRFYAFHSLLDLAGRHNASKYPDDLVATVLITFVQLGELIA